VSEERLATEFAAIGGIAGLVRAVFVEGDEAAEGLFALALVPATPFMNGPGGHTGRANMVVGVTAPKSEFARLMEPLAGIARSFRITEAFVDRCMRESADAHAGVMRAGETLRQSSETIVRAWHARSKRYDIMSEKYADGIRGVERLYDPDTDEVYEFKNGFHDRYRLNPNGYKLPRLRPLPPDSHALWTKAPLNGPRHLM
jgi:hypothetical protein